ncbi:MAG: hypothetical protein KDA24_26660 [Deltaproteobacteria bacterium]|nr:hypothetical protein [Deltaproteobacteria bacterium]
MSAPTLARWALALLACVSLSLFALVGCEGDPEVEVATLGTAPSSVLAATPGILSDLLDVDPVTMGAVDDSAWPRCMTKNGSHALLAHPDAVRKALAPSDRGPRVLVTDLLVAIDRPGAPCSRVFGAAPPNSGVVLVSARELRNRCSSLPVAELVGRVAAHELGHALGLTLPGEGMRCDGRGCHCEDPDCLLADERGGCPQADAALCTRCRLNASRPSPER